MACFLPTSTPSYSWRIYFIRKIYGFRSNCICKSRASKRIFKAMRSCFEFCIVILYFFVLKESSAIFRPFLINAKHFEGLFFVYMCKITSLHHFHACTNREAVARKNQNTKSYHPDWGIVPNIPSYYSYTTLVLILSCYSISPLYRFYCKILNNMGGGLLMLLHCTLYNADEFC